MKTLTICAFAIALFYLPGHLRAADSTPIIEAKWGTAPGQVGTVGPMDRELLGFTDRLYSVAVGCDNSIYILDPLNNRIQKFSQKGEYLTSIPIDGCVDEVGKSCVIATQMSNGRARLQIREDLGERKHVVTHGVNIAIDSQNTLYYYSLNKNIGEIWEFRSDKLVSKSTAPISADAASGLGLTLQGDRLWLFNIKANGSVREKRHYDYKARKEYSPRSFNDWKAQEEKRGKRSGCAPTENRRKLQVKELEEGISISRKTESK